MAHAAFNTYLFLDTLEQSGGFSHDQVTTLAKAMDVSQTDASELVTKSDLRIATSDLRAELKTSIAEVRTEIAEVRSELKTDIAVVRTEIAEVRTEIAQTANRIILWVVAMNAGFLAIIAKGFHWY